jgi:AbrB family looped-hinge helix DNA binding protein
MNRVKLSSKFQVVIPKDIREKAGLKAGTSFEIIQYGDRIELIPVDSIKKLNGFLKGIDTSIERDTDRI